MTIKTFLTIVLKIFMNVIHMQQYCYPKFRVVFYRFLLGGNLSCICLLVHMPDTCIQKRYYVYPTVRLHVNVVTALSVQYTTEQFTRSVRCYVNNGNVYCIFPGNPRCIHSGQHTKQIYTQFTVLTYDVNNKSMYALLY